MTRYPWYDIVHPGDNLTQGDFLPSCHVVLPLSSNTDMQQEGPVPAQVHETDVILMSQACDLEQRKIELVLVCPYFPLSEMAERHTLFKDARGKDKLRQGVFPGYHLLNSCEIEGIESEFVVVDFRNVYGVPISWLERSAAQHEKRRRLLPPYREHLSQAFARFFMRVGLPSDIPPFR